MPNPISSCKASTVSPMDLVVTHLYIARAWLTPMHNERESADTRLKAARAEVNEAIDICHKIHIIECQKLREG